MANAVGQSDALRILIPFDSATPGSPCFPPTFTAVYRQSRPNDHTTNQRIELKKELSQDIEYLD
ncbi:MAG: hypothetical protein ACLSFZ_04525 [Frisingicoccus sp.]